MTSGLLTAVEAVRAQWTEQAVRVAVTRAQRLRDDACLAMAGHTVAMTCPHIPSGRDSARRHLATLRLALEQLAQDLAALVQERVPSDLLVQVDSVELSRAELDAYLTRYAEPSQGRMCSR